MRHSCKYCSSSSSLAHQFSLAIQGISLRWIGAARGAKENSPFFVGSTSICIVISDWPAITPSNSSFCGDAHAFVMLDAKVPSVSLTDQLDHLLQLASDPSSEGMHQGGRTALPTILLPISRIMFSITFGNFFSLVKCTSATGSHRPIILELETKALLILIISSFVDRDMVMRYHWGLGVGHTHAHSQGPSKGSPQNQEDRYSFSDASKESSGDEDGEDSDLGPIDDWDGSDSGSFDFMGSDVDDDILDYQK